MGGRGGGGGEGRGGGQGGEGGWGGRGVGKGGCWEGLQLPLVLANRPLADPGFQGGYPFEAKKRVRKRLWVWGEDLEGGCLF